MIFSTIDIERSDITVSAGVAVDEVQVTIANLPTLLFNGLSVVAFALAGGFDNATLQIDTAVMPVYGDISLGVLPVFTGEVTDVQLDGGQVVLTVSSPNIRLDTQIPRTLYQPQCCHTLFDDKCGLNPTPYKLSGAVLAGSDRSQLVFTDVNGAGFFELGRVKMTSGQNSGIARTVAVHSNSGGQSTITLNKALPFSVSVGDTFEVWAGCNKLRATCRTKFNNELSFLGWEYMPVPEDSL